jgi:SAM-dependent methyltransferase
MSEFDSYAEDYEAALQHGISVSGENADFFAKSRVAWLSQCLPGLQCEPNNVLDFGCGTGTATRFFFEDLGAQSVVGVDRSAKSLEVARRQAGETPATFLLTDEYRPDARMQLAYCNGVFHHVPVDERTAVAQYIADSLEPGGVFALWENNPWSPGARFVMSRVPFDRDAIMAWPIQARRLLESAGLRIVSTEFHFIFPKSLSVFRGLERRLTALPFGAQYQVLAQKPCE